MQTLPFKLCQLRKLVGLSQYQIAFFLNVSQSAYSHWETGETLPCWKNLEALSSFYQLDIANLMAATTDELLLRVFRNKVLTSLKKGGGG